MGRKILFITTDQQRYDSLGCNGGQIARTPVVDRLAAEGVNYRRAHNQNVVCMPARSTMLTGQYVSTHGVYANGVPLPQDAPSVAAVLAEGGYRTGLIGKAHFEPGFDFEGKWPENVFGRRGRDLSYGPHRGFEHMELARPGPLEFWHYGTWLRTEHPEDVKGFYALVKDGRLNTEGGGDTGLEQVAANPVPREHYHTDWVADRTIAWLDSLDADADWFCWMSFPDPHHPWDPPASEVGRVDWRELDLPPGHPGSVDACRDVLARKPRHWIDWFDGAFDNREGSPGFVPARMTHDQIREVNALVHVENELIDEACGKVLAHVDAKGWGDDTDVFFTTDHGELQGDFGLLFKGPYHTDALMRLPFVWRPAPSEGLPGAEVTDPVGQVDLAPTFCEIAGVPIPEWMQGSPLPMADGSRERVITEWDSQFDDIDMHMRSIYRDGWSCTAYEPGWHYDGTEGELYNVEDDPYQFHNRWDDPACAAIQSDLVTDLYDHMPPARAERLAVEAPA